MCKYAQSTSPPYLSFLDRAIHMAAHEEAGPPSPSGEAHEHFFFPPPTRTLGTGRYRHGGVPVGSPCVRMDATRRSAPNRTQPPCVHVIAERWGALRGSLMAARECWTSGSTVTCEPRASGPPPPRRRRRQRVPLASERTPGAETPLYDRRATERCYMRIPTLWMAAVTVKSEHV